MAADRVDYPALERATQQWWNENNVLQMYLKRNSSSDKQYSFLDGPITANNPMGVHHAWGRTYKDLYQRYKTMQGYKQRYQNGFDCQGLWVEVEVERDLGLKTKRDIEAYGIAEFVERCKERVYTYSRRQTEQSIRLGYWMDWGNDYYTMSDENNYTIWLFLKKCYEGGKIYKGHDVMPWCPRCATGLSNMEMESEGYKELSHLSLYVKFPLVDRPGENLLVWTTTPWTLAANVAAAVHPDMSYVRVEQDGAYYYLAEELLPVLKALKGRDKGDYHVTETLKGSDMLGWRYRGPFDELPAEQGVVHSVIAWKEVSASEGTGIVHIAPGCGREDFGLSKEFNLAVVAPVDESGVYIAGYDWLTGQHASEVGQQVAENLTEKGLLYRPQNYKHRYPTCWRCYTQLVFRLVDEWFIAMDPLREPMMRIAREIRWIPDYGLDRELDWLRNMDDWMISKKRYWGLALPFWVCSEGHLEVIGGNAELFERAIGGLEDFESPHRPWVDAITIRCWQCGQVSRRVPDVSNVWLDAGIVPFSTLGYGADRSYWREWFPADFITESFPGQFRNWFYSMLAMSAVLEDAPPFRTVLGYGLMRDEAGREMHKSWGNLIPFNEAAERAGADVMRWLFCQQRPDANLNFGWRPLEEVKRRLLVLWNTYSFFVTYANLDRWSPGEADIPLKDRPLLDRWAAARLNGLVAEVRSALDGYDAMAASHVIEGFIGELSTWYVRRSRRRFWKAENDLDKQAAYQTLYECLTTLTRLLAPFMPFMAEALYQNLVRNLFAEPASVHLTSYPEPDARADDAELLEAMGLAQQVVALGRAARERAAIKVRQPLRVMHVRAPDQEAREGIQMLQDIILSELNVKRLEFAHVEEDFVDYDVRPNLPLLGPRYGKRMPKVRQALQALDPALVARCVEQGQTVTLSLNGDTVDLLPQEVLAEAREREGYAAMAGHGFLVALDIRLDRELVREGLAREVVRRINDWRKVAGFEIEDRIAVRYDAGPCLAEAIEEHREYICQETLATSLMEGSPGGKGFQGGVVLDGERLSLGLARV